MQTGIRYLQHQHTALISLPYDLNLDHETATICICYYHGHGIYYVLISNEGEEYLCEMLFCRMASRDVLKPMAGNTDILLVSNMPIPSHSLAWLVT
jgi:hypothetical protein